MQVIAGTRTSSAEGCVEGWVRFHEFITRPELLWCADEYSFVGP